MTSLIKKISLSNSVSIEQLGFGTFKIVEQQEANNAVMTALNNGYRSFDTAQLYNNEKILGEAFVNSGVARQELFLTTKVSNLNQGYEQTLKSFEQSLKDLQTDYLDLFLVHWPLKNHFFDTWKAIEQLYETKMVRAIGVCNFHQSHFELLKTRANIKPMINQIEIHPYLVQKELIEYLNKEQIAIEAWSPLARGRVVDEPLLINIGQKYQKSSSQVTLRWHVQKDLIVIPKSVNPLRIAENMQIFDFELTDTEMQQIDSLNEDFRTGPNPADVYQKNGF
ncbi:aldo/keto reductase [Gilliamella sp. B14448G11]|uniref:aldo/keto reductase n=1 Tax=unclassified Gilliamella TaxID=2685620 RepID=UPI0018DEA83E|nr:MULTISPECIES: aldo/keto reductase [unclassified Gilliamella]MBI0028707.1 aldo/keto reductase [Gilliamella sp. B14448G7]MBI0035394.1 aldo/keto reductase [Gilliamella sp. B14448G11]MBI0042573.1 aldo/keto reductase [Gilliamella sp. B14448G12]